jgi:putative SOS response-associated peptidase YedK
MCGRFTLRNTESIASQFGLEVGPNFNAAPSDDILTITHQTDFMRWGFNPHWARKPINLINARYETLNEKPSFRESKRCLILADGWYEWSNQENLKAPYYFHANDDILFFAGIYADNNYGKGCAIVTTRASEKISMIHHRMPLLINPINLKDWLEGSYDSETYEEKTDIAYYRVSSLVNSPNNNSNSCTMPINLDGTGIQSELSL